MSALTERAFNRGRVTPAGSPLTPGARSVSARIKHPFRVGDTPKKLTLIRTERTAPRLAYTVNDAAAALSVSRDFFEAWVLPEISTFKVGRLRIVPVAELYKWVADNARRQS